MKYLKIVATLVFAVLFLQSCNSDKTTAGADLNDVGSLALYEYNFEVVDFREVGFESDYEIAEMEPMRPDAELREDRLPPQIKSRLQLGKVFNLMNLSDEQKSEIRGLVNNNRNCETRWMSRLHSSRENIIKQANETKRRILQQYRNEEITRSEANRKMNQLNMRVRNALHNNSVNAEVREGIKNCRNELFRNIAQLLDEEQLEVWTRFVRSIK
ncbi:MAG: hypothetical protein WCZ17_10610 [Candidatus Kapaibacterium sp.]|jgi:hypothetical protein|nr:hypothetical protein [Candidatus Kapabacteria bacterium]